MRIIKHGAVYQNKKTKTFECSNCGCVFIAESNEYKIHIDIDDYYAYINCPDCNKTIFIKL